MRVELLPSSVPPTAAQFLVSFLVNDEVAIDGGAIGLLSDLRRQERSDLIGRQSLNLFKRQPFDRAGRDSLDLVHAEGGEGVGRKALDLRGAHGGYLQGA